MKKAIHCTQGVELFHLNTFDVGANRDYINLGLMEHELNNKFSKHLEKLENIEAEGIAVPGELLDRCAQQAPELLQQFKKIVDNKKLLAVPYYESHAPILTAEEFNHQLELQQKAYKEHFNKTAELYLGKVPAKLKKTLSAHKLRVVNPKVVYCDHKVQDELSDMQTHALEELSALYSHIQKTGDEDLLNNWRMLAHPSLIQNMNEEFAETPYDNYVDMIHICNDIAHRIKNFKLSQKGEFLSEPMIVPSPSALL